STNVWVYHTTTNTWTKGPALPVRRASAGMALVNNKLYFVSGEPIDHVSDSKDVFVLDLAAQSCGWKSVASIPEGRTHFGIAVVNNKIYVIGGQLNIDANATFLKTAYSYDPATNKWTRLADLPSPRSHLSPNTFALNGKIYSFGGENIFNHELNLSLVYDPATNKFAQLTPLPALRAAGAAGFVGGHIVFTGGKNNGFFSDTYIGTFV
ncbi:MAG: Kelch repeat type 1-containing protein, partial [Phycisphaerales bacterium]|nr:Kelch repeat type 1-containing protein [Phycisphaerales bacterium]